MSKRAVITLSFVFVFFAAACGTAATATPASPTAAAPSPTATIPGSAAPSASPLPTPVLLTVNGHVKMSDGRPVSGVRVRVSPMYISGADTSWGTRDRVPGPDVVVMSDQSGAYTATVSAWSLEALAKSASFQLSLFVTPPAGMKIVAITQADGFPSGPLAPNDPQWYFMLAREFKSPVDITVAAQ